MDQAKCLFGHQVKNFGNKNNIDIIEAPVNNHRAIVLEARLFQTIKSRLACIKEEKSTNNAFHVKYALKTIFPLLRICTHKTTKISPFEAHFGRKNYTPLIVISTKPKLSNLSYGNIVNHNLDGDTVMPGEMLPDEKWINGYRSDREVEAGMTRASQEAHNREQESTDSESRFLRTRVCRPLPLKKRAVELKLGTKIDDKRRSKKILEGLYEGLAPGSQIRKISLLLKCLANPLSQCETAISQNLEI